MRRIEIDFDAATIEALDDLADAEFEGDRNAAVSSLLEGWLAPEA